MLFDVLAHLSKDETRKTLLEKIALGFFAVAVIAEIIAYPYGQRNDELSANIIGSLSDKADTASTKADSAVVKLEALSKEEAAIQKRLDSASKQVDDVEKRVRAQGPRWLILVENKIEFIHSMKPFKDTKLTVLMCGSGISPIEQYLTEQRLLELLGKTPIGANWDTGYQTWEECPRTSSSGLELVVNVNANDRTKEAGVALKDELLGIGIATSLDIVPPDRAQFMASGMGGFGADSPWGRTLQQPNTIFLLVAPSAMAESAKPSKKVAKTPR